VAPRFPIIIGPTAGGKTDLAVDVAHLFAAHSAPGETVTADSVQIFRHLDIGSAKPTADERRGIPHHLIDIVDPADQFTVADWLARANHTVADIRARGHTPIVVGGTHLYIKAFLDGLFEGPPPDPALRERLTALGLPALRKQLEQIDPAAAARIHPNDQRRTIRALEVFHQTGTPISQLQTQWDQPVAVPTTVPPTAALGGRCDPAPRRGTRTDSTLIGLDWPPDLLARRINARVKDMIERGLIDEVRSLWEQQRLGPQSREALGYKQLIAHFEGRATLDQAVETVKIETRRFAKNQRTWLRRLRTTPNSVWINAAETPRDEWPKIALQACTD
jgi:tRNA dimethylallyltransferase